MSGAVDEAVCFATFQAGEPVLLGEANSAPLAQNQLRER